MRAGIAAGLLAVVILVSGCAQRAFVFLEQDQRAAQLEKDQAECAAEARENTRAAEAVKRGFGTTLGASVAGALVGAGLGALLGIGVAANTSSEDPKEVGLIIAGGAGVGAVVGWFVGTGLGVMASARHAQDLVDDAFQRCMRGRGYQIGRARA